MPSLGFLIYLAFLSVAGFLATDMYLPAFTAMQSDLHVDAGLISASLTVFLAGFASAQLFWGPLSDRLGRKPVLLMGLSLFALGCAGMWWAESAGMLLALRFIQAVGVCAAAVTWQALVIDRYSASQANRIFATIMPLVALSPALAPLLGAWVLNHASWRAIFIVLTLFAVAMLAATLFLRASSATPAEPSARKTGFLSLLTSPVYSGNVLIFAACSASFFAWLTGSPFILGQLGMSPADIGLSYVPQTLAFLIGGFGCRSLLKSHSALKLLPVFLIIYLVSIVAFFVAAQKSEPAIVALLLPFCGMALANGAIYPIVVANALVPFPHASGKAAALQNTLQLGLCTVASLIVSAFTATALVVTSLVMLSTVVLAIIGYILQRAAAENMSLANAHSNN